jgi:hypothetical protein
MGNIVRHDPKPNRFRRFQGLPIKDGGLAPLADCLRGQTALSPGTSRSSRLSLRTGDLLQYCMRFGRIAAMNQMGGDSHYD